jgi:murein DD-endopeptidase MepM/ murein hydrolase activator NlpD
MISLKRDDRNRESCAFCMFQFSVRHVGLFFLSALLFFSPRLFAQTPFQFPTANHALYTPGAEAKFFAPTEPDKPWTSGGFGCVRDYGHRMHAGLDILHLQTNRRGEPTDPVMATADGTVVYFSIRPSLSNFGNYIVLRHLIQGIEVYSLYAHLSAIQPGLQVGSQVKAGQVIATMGRTSNAEVIGQWRAHLHFQINLLLNDDFAAWFKRYAPSGEVNYHGEWNGHNLSALDPREILLRERDGKFDLQTFITSQTELCRVLVRATNFPFLKRYPMLVLENPRTQKEGIAGYEISLNFNGVPFALMPRAESEIKSGAKIQLLSVNEPVALANPCCDIVVKRGRHWQFGNDGTHELELLTYQ